jgi:putative DNA primase/helicase
MTANKKAAPGANRRGFGHNIAPADFIASDPLRAFTDALHASGIGTPPHVEADGQIHRFRGEGDKPGCCNCWYVLRADGGAFGSWRTGYVQTWGAGGAANLTADDLAALRAQCAADRRQRQAEREREHAKAARYAADLWAHASPANPAHPYLIDKGIEAGALRQSGGALLVPLINIADNALCNLQRIHADGRKRFLYGGRITAAACILGNIEDAARVLICEGYATGATLYEETNTPTACAMNAGNLLHVAKAVRRRWPAADVVICGDDDRATEGNPGRTKATEAAHAIGARLAFPVFEDGETGTDWNDWHANRREVAA